MSTGRRSKRPSAEQGPVDPRVALARARTVVVKVGSRALGESKDRFRELADDICAIGHQRASARSGETTRRRVVLVSSGAIAFGYRRLGLKSRPTSIDLLQASASAGQSLLMRAYEEAFATHDQHVAQVLLTHADLSDRERYLNARAALEALLERGVVPIVNENDTVAVDEIRFGDNDQLAAMLATLIGADLLVLLTDVVGLLDATGARVPVVRDVATDALPLVKEPASRAPGAIGSGGMGSKLEAARRATLRGVSVVIAAAAEPHAVPRVLAGEDLGTLFLPKGSPLASRKHWIGYTLKPKGAVLVDEGAVRALGNGRSLLPAGVVGVRGEFAPGEPVSVVGPDGAEIARGLARYGTLDVARLARTDTSEIERRIGHYAGDEVLHRDDIVVL